VKARRGIIKGNEHRTAANGREQSRTFAGPQVYAELKTRVSIHDAIQKLGLELKPAGHQLRGFCPQCKAGGDRALVITPDKSLFYCFNAKIGGDQIALSAPEGIKDQRSR
jgi:hypothetical protein